MLTQIAEFRKTVLITGFQDAKVGDARVFLDNVRSLLPPNVELQIFDADIVTSWQHLYFAALNALTAFKSGRNLSKSLAVETVLYASAQRQIKKALDIIGVKRPQSNVAVLVLSENVDTVNTALAAVATCLGAPPDETVLNLTPTKTENIKKVFDISDTELTAITNKKSAQDALVDLVIERIALLSTRL